jgi:ABC-type amino acid transport substrate-binding protein
MRQWRDVRIMLLAAGLAVGPPGLGSAGAAGSHSPANGGAAASSPRTRDLPQILATGELRHLGVPYANFVTGAGDGLDVELIRAFAQHLGVRYVYVPTTWDDVITDVTGLRYRRTGNQVEIVGAAPVRGDLVANGLTVLSWRRELVEFSSPTFPTQIWLITRADDPLAPIAPSGDLQTDIDRTGDLLRHRAVLCKRNTCLDPSLFPLEQLGARPQLFDGSLNELAPALIRRAGDATILDVPDALIALRKWSGRIKVIGPFSPPQEMAVAFPKSSPELRRAFGEFLREAWLDGRYRRLVEKYYPTVFAYFGEFFDEQARRAAEPRTVAGS